MPEAENYPKPIKQPSMGLLAYALVPGVALAVAAATTGYWLLGLLAGVLAILGGWLASRPFQFRSGSDIRWAAAMLLYLAALAATVALGYLCLQESAVPAAVSGIRGLLLVGIALGGAVWELQRSGAESLRRVWSAARAVQQRSHWPAELEECAQMPEVRRLQQVVPAEQDIRPVLVLLSSPRPPVQLAALQALAYRKLWSAGEAEYVLQAAGQSPHVPIRKALVRALAGVCGVELLTALTSFLRDPATEVREQAALVLLWQAEQRWPLIRESIREVLADPLYPLEGSLWTHFDPAQNWRLPAAAIADLITWAAEPPPLAPRAILTLIAHFRAELQAGLQPALHAEIAELMLHPDTPTALRVELAALLRDCDLLSPELLDRLTNVDQPAPMRLFAAEMMLRINPHDPDGIDVLRGLARQSNRELALHVALILQSYLGLDFGVDPQAPPPTNSRAAAELTRRLVQWANQCQTDPVREALATTSSQAETGRCEPEQSIHHTPSRCPPPTAPSLHDGLEESHFIPLEQVLEQSPSRSTTPPHR